MNKVGQLLILGFIILVVVAFFIIDNLSKGSALRDSTNISFIMSSDNLHSGHYDNIHYKNYSLTISTPNEDFSQPSISFTPENNVTIINTQLKEKTYIVNFNLLTGENFEYKFTTANYQPCIKSFTATPFVNNIDIGYYQINDETKTAYNLQKENDSYVLYYANTEANAILATSENKPSILKFQTTTNKNSLSTLDISTDKPDILQITNDTIHPLKTGNAKLILTAKDGSNFKQEINYKIKEIEATSITTKFDDVIQLEIGEKKILETTYEPSYATLHKIEYQSKSTETIYTIQDSTITAVSTGSTALTIKLNNKTQKNIIIKVVAKSTSNSEDNPSSEDNQDSNDETTAQVYTSNLSIKSLPEGTTFTNNTLRIDLSKCNSIPNLTLIIKDKDNNIQNLKSTPEDNVDLSISGESSLVIASIEEKTTLAIEPLAKGTTTLVIEFGKYSIQITINIIIE